MSSKGEVPQGAEGGGLLATTRAAIHGTSEDLTAIPVQHAAVQVLAVALLFEGREDLQASRVSFSARRNWLRACFSGRRKWSSSRAF
jgi:hypothetical protein